MATISPNGRFVAAAAFTADVKVTVANIGWRVKILDPRGSLIDLCLSLASLIMGGKCYTSRTVQSISDRTLKYRDS